ncbi:MAG: glycosyltransferase family 4 protein [archaeon YNP-LCB-024-027]|jgi:glycosyltransferase involved in cell wall biosynthesis|nr:glycosyltransferase family 4 protein [Candidatus Culexarchaeum yellowstonense]
MKVSFILPHDFRFSQWSITDFIKKHHFSKNYLEAVGKKGVKTTLYCFHQDILDAIKVDNICFLPVEFRFPPFMSFGNDFSEKIMGEILQDRPDIIHVFNYYVWCYPSLIHKLTSKKIPTVAQFHGIVDNFSIFKLLFFRRLYKKTSLFLTSFICEAEKIIKVLRVSHKQVKLFPNVGVSLRLFKPYEKSSNPTLLYVGRFPNNIRNKWEKNPFLVIKLFEILKKKFANLNLLMVGEGPGLSKIKSYVDKKEINKDVLFKGYIKHCHLPQIYSNAWFTVIPMYFPEMTYLWDGSLKESLACETPVIIFGDHFKLNEWGLMIPYNRSSALAEKLPSIFSRYDEYFSNMSYVRKLLEKYCSWENVSKHLINTYETIIRGKCG